MFRRKQKKFSKKTEREKKSLIKNQIPGKDCMIDNAKVNILPEVVRRFDWNFCDYIFPFQYSIGWPAEKSPSKKYFSLSAVKSRISKPSFRSFSINPILSFSLNRHPMKWKLLFAKLKNCRYFWPLQIEMVFCYQNCSDLLWEKNVLKLNYCS